MTKSRLKEYQKEGDRIENSFDCQVADDGVCIIRLEKLRLKGKGELEMEKENPTDPYVKWLKKQKKNNE